MRKLTIIILTMLLLWTIDYGLSTSFAAIPKLINYQGKLLKSDGTPQTDTKNITFRLYESSSGGTIKWQGTYLVKPDKGIFNVMLGEKNDSPYNFSTLDFAVQYWLGIQIEGDTEMGPLQPLVSSAYAFNSARLDGKPVTEFSLANHTHDTSSITAGILPVVRGGTGVGNKTTTIIQYTGNGVNNRTVAHGLGTTPTCVEICSTDMYGASSVIWLIGMGNNSCKDLQYSQQYTNAIIGVNDTNVTLGPHGAVNMNGKAYTMRCTVGQ